MKNYVIINGTNSNTLTGLMINELPPITKPEMRTQIEEIDGRDGDIITKLGYSAYDKTITIGLFGTGYDVDNIIKFFNKEGTIVFSNEPDKYYNFTQVNNFDIERLLKFKTASITFHCQPFKYPLTETQKIIQPTILTSDGENITINNTASDSLKLSLKGNTSQASTPTPTSPIPVSVVSGDNDIKITGKNLLNPIGASSTTSGITFTNNGNGTYTANGTASAGVNFALTNLTTTPITLDANQKYTQTLEIISGTFGGSIVPAFKNSGGTITYNYFNCNGNSGTDSKTPTEKMTAHTYNLYLGSGVTISNCTFRVQLEKGTSTPYEPYTSQTYEVDLPVENIATSYRSSGSGYYNYNYDNSKVSKTMTLSFMPNFSATNTTIYARPQIDGTLYTLGTIPTITSGKKVSLTFTLTDTQISEIKATTGGFFQIYDPDLVFTESYVSEVQLEPGTKANHYTPYGTTPIELCKIGTYQDYFTKNSDGEWCKYNAIGKVVLDGSESSWSKSSTTTMDRFVISNAFPYSGAITSIESICSHFVRSGSDAIGKYDFWNDNGATMSRGKFNYTAYGTTTLEQWKTWLGSNNISVYYVLATPYLSLIEDNNLIEQLDNIQNATSYEGTTNINQVNNDKAFIISAKALEKGTNEAVVNNIGNVYSKPLLALEGNGNVDIYLDNTQILKANVESKMNIDINTLEAYNPDTSALLNRQVIGNYNSMTLQPGNNTIRIDGALDKATITNYTRWL